MNESKQYNTIALLIFSCTKVTYPASQDCKCSISNYINRKIIKCKEKPVVTFLQGLHDFLKTYFCVFNFY